MRIWNAETGERLQQVWISNKKLNPIQVKFNRVGDWVSILASNGTLKIYSCVMTNEEKERENKQIQPENPKPTWSLFSGMAKKYGEEQ